MGSETMKMPKWKRAEVAAVEAALGSLPEICSRCHCTLATYSQKCAADLQERCEGFDRVDAAQQAHYGRFSVKP